jgi:hypothetical protein
MRYRRALIWVVFAAAAATAMGSAGVCWAAGNKAEIIVEMDRKRIYEGESVVYRVTLNNVDKPAPPELSGFDDFVVTLIGEQNINFDQTIINNGRISTISRHGRQYTYRLSPKRSGDLVIPAPTAEIDGVVLRGKPMRLVVTAPEDQDIVRMEITAEPESVYPLQPFTVVLSIAVKDLPEPYADENPLGVQTSPPELQIPWADDRRMPDGLQPKTDWRRWLSAMQSVRGTGFAINDIVQDSVFSFFEERRLAFMPQWQRIRRPDKSGEMAGYWQFQFKRTFVAKRVDQYSFGPVTLKGIFASGMSAAGSAQSADIYAVAKPLTVKIKDVPEEGRPDNFIGAIGRFKFDADLAPRKARTGDPMTLTLSFSGEGTLDSITAPGLSRVPQVAKNFKIYEATEQSKGDRKQFTYSLRPLESGIKEFPALAFSYFDVQSEKYVTLSSRPIPIEIEKADALAGRDIVASSNGPAPRRKDLEMRKEGIFANNTDLGQLGDQSIRPERWLAALGALVGSYAVLAFAVVHARRISGDTVRRRRRSAPSKARRLAAQAVKDLAAGRTREGADRLESAFVELVADWCDMPAAGMTPAEAYRQMQALGVDGEVLQRVRRFLDDCEGLHYGASAQAGQSLRHEAKAVVEAVIRALRRAG